MTQGVVKHKDEDQGWRKPDAGYRHQPDGLFASGMRHLMDFKLGKATHDEEQGTHLLANACINFLMWLEKELENEDN